MQQNLQQKPKEDKKEELRPEASQLSPPTKATVVKSEPIPTYSPPIFPPYHHPHLMPQLSPAAHHQSLLLAHSAHLWQQLIQQRNSFLDVFSEHKALLERFAPDNNADDNSDTSKPMDLTKKPVQDEAEEFEGTHGDEDENEEVELGEENATTDSNENIIKSSSSPVLDLSSKNSLAWNKKYLTR